MPSRCSIVACRFMDGDGLLLGFIPELVAGSDDLTAFDAGAGHPYGHGAGVVVAADALLRDRHAAEFAVPDGERVVEEAVGLEIRQEAGDGTVDLGGVAGVVYLHVVVGVPGVQILLAKAAVIELHEADATLHEAAGHEALPAERLRDLLVVLRQNYNRSSEEKRITQEFARSTFRRGWHMFSLHVRVQPIRTNARTKPDATRLHDRLCGAALVSMMKSTHLRNLNDRFQFIRL